MRVLGLSLLALCIGAAMPAAALETLHVGKAVDSAFTFTMLDVGVREGIFARYGLDVRIDDFNGDAKLQQGLATNSIGLGVGSGPSMAFTAKGAPQIAVAAFAGPPANFEIVVNADSPIKSVADLKGKTISVSTTGSLTAWLVQRVSIAEGWGPNGIRMAALGGFEASVPALRMHEIDAMMSSIESSLTLQARQGGRLLTGLGPFAPVFITHVVFARKDLVANDPDLVRRFLKGFFASIAFMRSHRAETDKVTVAVLHVSPAVADEAYDRGMPMLSSDGRFDPKAVAVLEQSFIDMGILKTKPDPAKLFTSEFVPVEP